MIITEILPVTKQKSRIVTDEKLAFVLYKGELSRYKLAVGKELSQEVFTRIQQEVLVKTGEASGHASSYPYGLYGGGIVQEAYEGRIYKRSRGYCYGICAFLSLSG